jgi:hypothetical protein
MVWKTAGLTDYAQGVYAPSSSSSSNNNNNRGRIPEDEQNFNSVVVAFYDEYYYLIWVSITICSFQKSHGQGCHSTILLVEQVGTPQPK